MTGPRGWVSDLALGVRLAVGGGRTSLARFALSTFGVAVAVTVLLVGASVGTIVDRYHERAMANTVGDSQPIKGVDPVYLQWGATEFRGETIDAQYVHADGGNHPVPHGMRELPGPGELVASPALADLLDSPAGELLRPRFPGRVVEVLDQSVVPAPGDLIAYVGAGADLTDNPNVMRVYHFGVESSGESGLRPELLVLVLMGAVVLLLPVLVFIASASRIAGVERDRRLAALRLVGSGSRQVRRIAAAESLVGALAGLVLGAAAFLVLRSYAGDIKVFELDVYETDVVPDPVLTVAIVLLVPALAVLTALFAMRRTIIEPLGVVRYAKPVRRRLWWRLALIVVGVALLVTQAGLPQGSDSWGVVVSAGVALLLVGVPVLLPWLVERVAGRITGGPSSWQLAIRRLQLDSGTSARVVGGVAVVLAGAIALQTVLMTVESEVGPGSSGPAKPMVAVQATAEIADGVAAHVRQVPAVRDAHVVREAEAFPAVGDALGESYAVGVLDCATITELAAVRDCSDGMSWVVGNGNRPPEAGERLEFREYEQNNDGLLGDEFTVTGRWTVPDDVRRVSMPERSPVFQTLLLTPGALGGVRIPDEFATVHLSVGDIGADDVERVRNAIAAYGPEVYVFTDGTKANLTSGERTFLSVRNGLYVGSIITLLLAGVSLLVLALEHIRERRRPLAVLAASGVPQGVLARSLLWQVALPIALGLAVAVVTGVGLASLIVRLTSDPLSIDWTGVGLLSAAAAVLSLLVTAVTLPFLRSATRLTSLRTE